MKLKCHLQYERDFCNFMCEKGFHTERIASSGRRKKSVCDVITFTKKDVYFSEVKSTKQKRYVFKDTHGMLEKANEFNRPALLAIYFKSSHSSKGKGKWIWKILNKHTMEVDVNGKADQI